MVRRRADRYYIGNRNRNSRHFIRGSSANGAGVHGAKPQLKRWIIRLRAMPIIHSQKPAQPSPHVLPQQLPHSRRYLLYMCLQRKMSRI
jgi:hypothetical protein